jgi:RNA polymerase sigma factor (sigma-70 family)
MVRSQAAARSSEISVTASPAQSDEARLIRRVAAGDRRAFEALYRLYHPRLTRFLFNILRKPELVEEVLNDTLIAVWRRPDSYNGSSRLSTWIFAIAFRKALKARSRLDEPVEDKDADSRASDEAGPDQQLERRQAQQLLFDALKALSPDHRTVVDLTYFHEFGYREIAEIMDCPVDTVKTRMFHARRNLRNVLVGSLADWL